MKTHDVVNIPDLAYHIAPYLDRCTLHRCVQVSKAWASCFVPVLWRSFRLWHRSFRVKRGEIDIWQCLTDTTDPFQDKLRKSASEAFAKNGQFIRELTVENPGALRFIATHCSNLTKLVCFFRSTDDNYIQEHIQEISSHLWGLVERSPHLHTLRLGVAEKLSYSGLSWPFHPEDRETTARQLLHLQNLPMLRHLSVAMTEDDYFEFCERFPRLLEARFCLSSRQSIIHPYKATEAGGGGEDAKGNNNNNDDDHKARQGDQVVQYSLKKLVLDIEDGQFDGQTLQCVFRRFPRLERLKIYSQARMDLVFLDLSTDKSAWWPYNDVNNDGYELSPTVPALEVSQYVPHVRDYEVAGLISALPVPLKQMHWTFLNERTIEALAVHSSETLEEVSGGVVFSNNETYDQPEDEMQKTVGALLARCPQLKKVLCPRLAIHIRYLMEHPWVCCDNLEVLSCRLIGIPKMSTGEESLLGAMMKRQKKKQAHRGWTEEEQRVLAKHALIVRCVQALQDQLEKCPNLQHSFHHHLKEGKSKTSSMKRCLNQ
ncbi:hypothetical protein DFQ26_006042 [Actinomortierella ambigua]|nr:hypothetical protein DFQ26_006042 [Actinomortierella ambigua]